MRLSALFPVAWMLLSASALPGAMTQWAFDTITLQDGGTARGSFVYDTAPSSQAGRVVSIDIITTPGTFGTPGVVYGDYCPPLSTSPDTRFWVLPDASLPSFDGSPILLLLFDQSLVFSGATQVGVRVTELICADPQCLTLGVPGRAGTGVARVVPEPDAGLLLLTGAAILGLAGRRMRMRSSGPVCRSNR